MCVWNKEYYYNEPEKKGLKIGLLASNPDLYSNRRIIEAGEMRGHEMHFLNIKYCYMKLSASNPEIHYRGGKVLDNFDAVIPASNLTSYEVKEGQLILVNKGHDLFDSESLKMLQTRLNF